MQHLLLVLSLILLTSLAQAQCDKVVIWHATRVETIDSTGEILEEKKDIITVLTSKDSILIMRRNDKAGIIRGVFREKDCNWKKAFKNGKSSYRTQILHHDQTPGAMAKVTIEGIDGELSLILAFDKIPNSKMKLLIDSYDEK